MENKLSIFLKLIPPYQHPRRVLYWVLGLHTAVLLYLTPAHFSKSTPLQKPMPKVVVKTVKLRKKNTPTRKKTNSKKKSKKVTSKKINNQQFQKALDELSKLQSIDAIDDNIPTLKIDKHTPINTRVSYEEELTGYLRQWLKLPEYGNVTVEIKISREGHILDLKILSSENKKNSNWVKEHLSTMTLPSFKKSYKGLNEKSFVLVLSNE